MPAGPLTPAKNLVKAPQKCRAFFHSLALKYGTLLRPRPRRYVRTLARGYCFHASNASAKVRLPDKPFFMARIARRLLL